MTALTAVTQLARPLEEDLPADAELAAAAILARYQGRTLDAYRHDLRAFFQWASDTGLDVLGATRPQIELYVRAMEERGLAATTIDRRLSTVCAITASPTSTAALPPTRLSTCAAPRCTRATLVVWTAPSWDRCCSRPSALTTPMPPSPSCSG